MTKHGDRPREGDWPVPNRRRLLVLPLALAAGAWSAGRGAGAATLPAPASLAAELAAALGRARPLVVMASLHGCPFCDIVRDRYLAPLLRDGQPVIQLDMGSAQPVLDFDGVRKSHGDLLRAWQVKTAPTVLFLGKGGREIAERLVGAGVPDFYGAYLDERLRAARRKLG